MLEKLKNLLLEEIKKVPRPFGVFLSGGMDSAILTALSKPDFVITCNFPLGEKYDELKYAQIVARYFKIPLTIIRPRKEDFKEDLVKAIKIIGQPTNSVSIVPWYKLMEATKGKIMINGEGADELFGGYSRYLILKQVFELYKRPELKNYKPTLDFLFKDIHSRLVEKELKYVYEKDKTDMENAMNLEFNETLPDILFMERRLSEHFDVDFYQPFMGY